MEGFSWSHGGPGLGVRSANARSVLLLWSARKIRPARCGLLLHALFVVQATEKQPRYDAVPDRQPVWCGPPEPQPL